MFSYKMYLLCFLNFFSYNGVVSNIVCIYFSHLRRGYFEFMGGLRAQPSSDLPAGTPDRRASGTGIRSRDLSLNRQTRYQLS